MRVAVALIVAAGGCDDGTVEAARRGGATVVLDLPRMGKLSALNRGVEASSGELLVFTDADSMFERGTLRRLVSNFADERVGGTAPVAGTALVGGTASRAAGGPGRLVAWLHGSTSIAGRGRIRWAHRTKGWARRGSRVPSRRGAGPSGVLPVRRSGGRAAGLEALLDGQHVRDVRLGLAVQAVLLQGAEALVVGADLVAALARGRRGLPAAAPRRWRCP